MPGSNNVFWLMHELFNTLVILERLEYKPECDYPFDFLLFIPWFIWTIHDDRYVGS